MLRGLAVVALVWYPVGGAMAACGADALGTARTIHLKREAAAFGTVQYGPLPLRPGEVVITFDDGPHPELTPRVLEALGKQCVKATFFMNGEPMARHAELAKQIAAQGHSTAMHGFQHEHFAKLEADAQLADLKAMQEVYANTYGRAAPAYRFPFLEETPVLLDALKAAQVTVMSVDIAVDDWLPDQSPEMLTARMLERLKEKRGGIILMHDPQHQTVSALPALLRALKDNGYSVVHVNWD